MDDFIKSCVTKNTHPIILNGAEKTAKLDFNLKPKIKILKFIGNGGLERPHLINVKPWENNPNSTSIIMVDAYGFYSGEKYGYLAFFYQPITRKWILKSFKKNSQPDPRSLPFQSLGKLLSRKSGDNHG
ncbi:hypothetical protein [Legionella bozemanae]|uniref:hypothetical protein n=1 Tax=Legionella bozemanae TaxID=447 RepID=UPI00104187A2|nr:hypothetical protein [Legionella bozemanae]